MRWKRPKNTTIHWHIQERSQKETLIQWVPETDVNGDPVRDNHGDIVWNTVETPVTLAKAFQTNTKVPVKVNDERGQLRSFDFEFYSSDDVFFDLEADIRSVGRVPVITWDNQKHRITNIECHSIGGCRIITEQERS